MTGTVNIARDIWSDPTFKDSEMSQREAWIWMIAEASWKARTWRVGTFEVDLERGQLAASSRGMAQVFMWSEPRVRRYLEMLENRRMIKRKTDAGVTVITICNYDEYQNAPRETDAPPTQQPTQDRRTADAIQNKVIREEKKTLALFPDPKPESRFDEFWNTYPHRGGAKKGKVPAERSYRRAVQSGASEQEIIDGAVRYRRDRQVTSGFAKDPATWLNQLGWADEVEAPADVKAKPYRYVQGGIER